MCYIAPDGARRKTPPHTLSGVGSMTLVDTYGVHNAAPHLGSLEWLRSELTLDRKPPAEAVIWHVVEYAAALAAQGRIDLAQAWVIELSQRFDMTLAHYFEVCTRLQHKDQTFKSTNIIDYYLKNGGTAREAFESEIFRYYQQDDFEKVIKTYQNSQRWSSWKTIRSEILFLVANSFMSTQRLDDSFVVMSFLVDEYPDIIEYRTNVIYLARNHNYSPAYNYIKKLIHKTPKSFKNLDIEDDPDGTHFIVDLNTDKQDKILSSLYQHGFCHIKNGIDVDVAKEVFNHILEKADHCCFPIGFDSYIMERCESLLRFDARSIVNALLLAPGTVDERRCVVRKVDPGAAQSFTPFHQDGTAFHKALVNVWTPLTPAGGDYPTLELVKRRLTFAEAPLETSDGYNLVKLDDADILRKYEGDLYAPTDVTPGECIIFLGTTIHRSTNLSAATKSRYNLEIRWS